MASFGCRMGSVSMRAAIRVVLVALTLSIVPRVAVASGSPNPYAYAIVVGSNPGGKGQEALEFAEADARRVKQLLVELGRYEPRNVELVLRPNTAQVLASLDRVRGRIARHHDQGEDATLFFYYSGHARARALNLGPHTLDLAALRERLTALPTALTIVVLDACQSGAFSRVKGAEPAADFSFNSVASLNTRGLVVMASSSSGELSQESARLGSSYFTHYLLVGLRGGADRNDDGRVSLDEAYKYAYGETLNATSRTAVGGQHVTLETDLTGQGEVPMTYPAAATSKLVLPRDFGGQLLLQTRPHHAVLAELTKTKGSQIQLAVPPGRYDGVVRRSGRRWECRFALGERQEARLALSACTDVADEPAQSKGDAADSSSARETWAVELSGGFSLSSRDDSYIRQLDTFGYQSDEAPLDVASSFRWALGASIMFTDRFSFLARARLLETRDFRIGEDRSFGFSTYVLGLGARATFPLTGPSLKAYGQLEAGPALAFSSYVDDRYEPKITDGETFLGVHGAASAGLQLMPWRSVGPYMELNYTYAPVVSNLIGSVHDSGGLTLLLGLRATTGSAK